MVQTRQLRGVCPDDTSVFTRTSEAALRDRILAAGEALDLRVAGVEALWQAGLENWFFNIHREGKHDLTPIELGLSWRVSFAKEYVGSSALRERRRAPKRRRVTAMRAASSLAPGDPVHEGATEIGSLLWAERSITLGDSVAIALLDEPYWHSGIDAYRVRGEPVRTVSAPLLTNRSLFVNPQKHAYADRAAIRFPEQGAR
jgi:glycine cleavage system aminomethyltransferase T